MKRLSRYLFGAMLGAVCAAWAILLGLYMLAEFLQQAETPRAGWEAGAMLRYLALHLPQAAFETLPYAALLGCLLRMGALLRAGEVTALRIAGVSPTGIALRALAPALVLSLAALALAQFVIPHSNAQAQAVRDAARGAAPDHALWRRENGDYLYFRASARGDVLHDFARYRIDEQHRLRGVLRAERADYDAARGGWTLRRARELRIDGDAALQIPEATRFWERTALRPDTLRLLLLPPGQLSLSQRWRHAGWLQGSGIDAAAHQLRFWRDLLLPLSVAGLTLLGLAFLFGALRGEGAGARIAAGVLICFLFSFLSDTAGSTALVYSLSPFWAALAPPAALLAAGLWMLRRR